MWFGRGILDTIYMWGGGVYIRDCIKGSIYRGNVYRHMYTGEVYMRNVYRYMYIVGVYIKRSIYKENVYRGMYIGGTFIGRSLICCWRLVRSSVY